MKKPNDHVVIFKTELERSATVANFTTVLNCNSSKTIDD